MQVLFAGSKLGCEDDYPSYSKEKKRWSATLSQSIKLNVDKIARNRNRVFAVEGCTLFLGRDSSTLGDHKVRILS